MIAKSLHQIVSTSRSLLVGDAARLEAAPPGTITVHHSFGDPDDPLEDFHITEHAPPPKPAKKMLQRADQLFDDDADTRFELVLPWTQTKAPPAVSSIRLDRDGLECLHVTACSFRTHGQRIGRFRRDS